jgi:hypothetical protein
MLGILFALVLPVSAQQIRTGSPMIYSTPLIKTVDMSCANSETLEVLNLQKQPILNLCEHEYRVCLIEGSCIVETPDQKKITISYIRFNSELQKSLFYQVPSNLCPYGLGAGKDLNGKVIETCRDPYFSVSADPKVHHVGKVIFVPKLVDVKLPTGEIHDGYLIIRDANEELADFGQDVFGFFTGIERYNSSHNPLIQLGIANTNHTFEYQYVDEEKSKQVLKQRGYPRLNSVARKGFLK